MRKNIAGFFWAGIFFGSGVGHTASEVPPLVPLSKIDASIRQEMRYAGENNPTGKVIYDEPVCVLREPVAKALAAVQAVARLQGVSLKVLDCYRPESEHTKVTVAAKEAKWKAFSADCGSRCAGGSVDVTLIDSSGVDLAMPAKFGADTETWKRGRDAISSRARRNHKHLVYLMKREGFVPDPKLWSRFEAKDAATYAKSDRPLGDFAK